MNAAFPYTNLSGWIQAPEDLQPNLDQPITADVVVMGGGYTGLSTAINLRNRGFDVVVLERHFAGSGSSGRNAGHVSPTIGKDIPSLLMVYGEEKSRKLLEYAEAAVDYTERFIADKQMDCEYRPSGNIIAGLLPKHSERLYKASQKAKSIGANVTFLDNTAMRSRNIPEAFTSGILEPKGGILNPGKYVSEMRQIAIDMGVRLFENSPLEQLEAGPQIKALTKSGSVTAEKAVLATNAYTKTTGWHKRAVIPIRVSLFETQPLTDAQLKETGWTHREGLYTTHETLESFRLTESNTIVGGSKKVTYDYNTDFSAGYNEKTFATIHQAFKERFPACANVPIQTYWGGWIAMTPEFLPRIGTTGPFNNVHYGYGYNGHGVPQATMMGNMLADAIEGKDNTWLSVLSRRTFDAPPEPLTWLGANGIIRFLDILDKRTDRQIRAQQAMTKASIT